MYMFFIFVNLKGQYYVIILVVMLCISGVALLSSLLFYVQQSM